jgi:hypothetical protein
MVIAKQALSIKIKCHIANWYQFYYPENLNKSFFILLFKYIKTFISLLIGFLGFALVIYFNMSRKKLFTHSGIYRTQDPASYTHKMPSCTHKKKFFVHMDAENCLKYLSFPYSKINT